MRRRIQASAAQASAARHPLIALGALFLLVGSWSCAGERRPAVEARPAIESATLTRESAHPWHRDWQACPAIARIADAGDLLVIGDVHGDLERLEALLAGTGIVDGSNHWDAADATLVFVGDFTGKYRQSLGVLSLIQVLQEQAREVGGDVMATMGNHEAEFLAPDSSGSSPKWAKKTKEFRQELQSESLDPENVWRRVGNGRERETGEFLHCLPVAAKSDRWFFAHAGSTQGTSLNELEDAVVAGVDDEGYRTAVLMDVDFGLLEARMKPEEAVWWQRSGDTPEESAQRLQSYAAALGVSHLAVGHQAGKRKFNGDIERPRAHVFQLFEGAIYLNDVGMSRGQDDTDKYSPGAVLRIARGRDGEETVTVLCGDGQRLDLPPSGQSSGVHCPFP